MAVSPESDAHVAKSATAVVNVHVDQVANAKRRQSTFPSVVVVKRPKTRASVLVPIAAVDVRAEVNANVRIANAANASVVIASALIAAVYPEKSASAVVSVSVASRLLIKKKS